MNRTAEPATLYPTLESVAAGDDRIRRLLTRCADTMKRLDELERHPDRRRKEAIRRTRLAYQVALAVVRDLRALAR